MKTADELARFMAGIASGAGAGSYSLRDVHLELRELFKRAGCRTAAERADLEEQILGRRPTLFGPGSRTLAETETVIAALRMAANEPTHEEAP